MIRYKIFPDQELVSVRIEGQTGYADVRQWLTILLDNEQYQPGFALLFDLRRAKLSLLPQDMKQLLPEDDEERGRWAFLVETPMETALAKSYQSNVGTRHDVGLFCTIAALSDYLGGDVRPLMLAP